MTNLYLTREVYQTIELRLEQDALPEYKHPFDGDLIILHPAYPYTFDQRAVSCIKPLDGNLFSGYVDIFNKKNVSRFNLNPATPQDILKEQLRLYGIKNRSRDEHNAYVISNVFCMGMYAVVAINDGVFDKRSISKPKIWKSKRKRYKAENLRDAHWLVEIGKSYTQSSPEALSGNIEQRHHMRRGHWRFIPSKGEKVWVKPYWAGNKQLGTIIKDYKT